MKPAFSHFCKHLFVSGDVIEHPSVADVVEAATDVTLQHPLGAVSHAHNIEALLDSVSGRAFRSKTIGVKIGCCLRDGEQRQQVNACIARSFIVGIPSGFSFPLAFGM
jgi:hypothetical protein